jgi:hypothetical protein
LIKVDVAPTARRWRRGEDTEGDEEKDDSPLGVLGIGDGVLDDLTEYSIIRLGVEASR